MEEWKATFPVEVRGAYCTNCGEKLNPVERNGVARLGHNLSKKGNPACDPGLWASKPHGWALCDASPHAWFLDRYLKFNTLVRSGGNL